MSIYNKYFEDTTKLLLADFNRSSELSSTLDKGQTREHFLNIFLKRSLPGKLIVSSGEIIGCDSKVCSGQIDTIIVRNDSFCLDYGLTKVYPIDGIFAVIEIKSNG